MLPAGGSGRPPPVTQKTASFFYAISWNAFAVPDRFSLSRFPSDANVMHMHQCAHEIPIVPACRYNSLFIISPNRPRRRIAAVRAAIKVNIHGPSLENDFQGL